MGRLSTYSQVLADTICESVATGDSLSEAARKQQLKESTVRLWRDSHPEFAAKYARAVIERAEVFFERGNKIAFSAHDSESAQVARVQLDWLKWAACKLSPKKYGDRLDLEHSGEVSVKRVVSDI